MPPPVRCSDFRSPIQSISFSAILHGPPITSITLARQWTETEDITLTTNIPAFFGHWDQVATNLDSILGPAPDGGRTGRACQDRFKLLAVEGKVAAGPPNGASAGPGGVTEAEPRAGQEVNPAVIVGKKLKRNSEAYQKKKAGGAGRKAAPGTPGTGKFGRLDRADQGAWCRL